MVVKKLAFAKLKEGYFPQKWVDLGDLKFVFPARPSANNAGDIILVEGSVKQVIVVIFLAVMVRCKFLYLGFFLCINEN